MQIDAAWWEEEEVKSSWTLPQTLSEVQIDFEDWITREYPFSVTNNTFDKIFFVRGTFDRYQIDIVDKMWKAYVAGRVDEHKFNTSGN